MNPISNKRKPLKLTRREWIRAVLYSGVVLMGSAGYISSRRLEIVRADVPLARLPKRLDGLEIGVMSDFHAGAIATRENILEAVSLIGGERPDMIVLLGDYVDGANRPDSKDFDKRAHVFDALKGLKAPLGIYAVLGNHDHWTDAGLVRKALSRLPISVLDDQNARVDDGLAVAGVDDYWEGPARPYEAIKDLSAESVVVLLSHNPDVNLQLKGDKRVGLVISGHTHGGQLRIPIIKRAPWVPCSKKYGGTSGLIKESEHRWTFITKGVGTFFVPVRLFCPPDIGVLRLRKV